MTWNPDDHPAVAMPLGGIGTGSMALGSDGGWRQIQLSGVGNHRGDLPGTFMALRTSQHEPIHDETVVLQAARADPGSRGSPATPMFNDDLVPAWQRELVEEFGGTETTMTGTYPVASVVHETGGPVSVEVCATSPMVPTDADASGYPAVMLEVTLTNHNDTVTQAWLAHSVHNAVGLDAHLNPDGVRAPGYGGNVNTMRRRGSTSPFGRVAPVRDERARVATPLGTDDDLATGAGRPTRSPGAAGNSADSATRNAHEPIQTQSDDFPGSRISEGQRVDLVMDNPSVDPASPWAGQMVLGCVADAVVALPSYSSPSELFDFLRLLAPWGDHTRGLAAPSVQAPQNSAPSLRYGPSPEGQTWLGALVGHAVLEPGQSKTMRFTLAWHFPNRMVDFVQFGPDRPELGNTRFWLGNHYASRWADAVDVADEVHREWGPLWHATTAWTDVVDGLDLPAQWRTHLATQPVPLRTPTSFRTHDGAFYGFEGVLGASTGMWSGDVGGSCPLNCTHVWNYAMAASALFPSLERSMRETEFDVMQARSGALPHRVFMPPYLEQFGDGPIGGPIDAALDGMCGAVLKTYRELLRGAVGTPWVWERWGNICALMDHVVAQWDPKDTGLLAGIQPSTHDIGLHGTNTYMGTYWLAALRAAEELALVVGDLDRATEWRERFELSSRRYDEECFDGSQYVQRPDPSLPDEHQWGIGCLSDQLIGQWWAHTLGLGYLLPEDHVRTALRNIVKWNFRDIEAPAETVGGHVDDLDASATRSSRRTTRSTGEGSFSQRPYAVAGEQGLVMCTWPNGGRPEAPTLYCDEVWTGVEYQVAAHCIHEGLHDEATRILEAMWARHDGSRRNPFNEAECGDHYARAMAGWSVLEAELGLAWNALDGTFRVGSPEWGGSAGAPTDSPHRDATGRTTVPLLTGSGWAEVQISPDGARARCNHGRVPLRRVVAPSGEWIAEGNDLTPADGWLDLAPGSPESEAHPPGSPESEAHPPSSPEVRAERASKGTAPNPSWLAGSHLRETGTGTGTGSQGDAR